MVWLPTFSGDILNLDFMFMGHVTKDGENGKSRNKTGNTVDGAGQQGIPGREREAATNSPHYSLPPLPRNHWPSMDNQCDPSFSLSCHTDSRALLSLGKYLLVQCIAKS